MVGWLVVGLDGFFVCWFVWFGCLVGWLWAYLLVGWFVVGMFCLVVWLVGCGLICCLVGWLVWFVGLVGWLVGRFVVGLVGWLVCCWFDRLV